VDPIASALYAGANGVTSLVLVVLAVISSRRRPRTSYLQRWIAFCLLGALFTGCVLVAAQTTSPRAGAAFARLALASATAATLAFFSFGFAFARQKWGRRTLSAIGAAWSAILVVMFLATDLLVTGVTSAPHARFTPVPTTGMALYLAYMAYGWLVPLVLIVRVFLRSVGITRIQAAYMLIGFGIACVGSFGSLVPVLGPRRLLFIMPHLLLPLYPLTITYAIVRHRLWDVRTIIHKTAIWGMLSLGLLVPIFLFFRWGSGWLLGLSLADQAALLVVFFLLAHLYLQTVKPKLDHLFQRRIYDDRRALDRFAKSMAGVNSPDDVAQQLLDTLSTTLYPERVAVHFRLEHDQAPRCRTLPVDGPPPPSTDERDPFVARMITLGGAVDRSQLETDARFEDVHAEAEAIFAAWDAEVCLALVYSNKSIGLVQLGAKKNLRPYSRSDLEFLEQLGAAASIGLSNGLLFDRVDQQRRTLQELAATLEQRVQQRTSEIEEVNAKLSRANEDLKALDQLKSRFFANISHELRTPLTLILSPVETLLAAAALDGDDSQTEHLRGIKHNALDLLRLINDLLDLSRLEESRLRLRPGPVELHVMLARIVEMARPLAARNHLTLELDVKPLTIAADEPKLERVVVNLVSNAIKFTNTGGRVMVRLEERDSQTWIAVVDTGIGIPAEEQGRIFDRFHQVDPAITQRQGGTGIGLALAKELVELHGGTLRVESELGKGSVFTIVLPSCGGAPSELIDRRQEQQLIAPRRREADHGLPEWSDEIQTWPEYRFICIEDAVAQVSDSSPGIDAGDVPIIKGRAGGEIVLVIEDNAGVRRFIADILSGMYRVLTAPNGEVGLEVARRELPALVLCDVMMPVMNGLTVCRHLKEDARTSPIPVIMVTARKSVEDSVGAFAAGADDYVTKPFSSEELLARVAAQLRVRQLDQAVSRAERMAALGSTAAGLAHEIRNPLNAIINGLETVQQIDDAGRSELVDIMRRSALRILDAVEALQSFVRLDEAQVKSVDLHRGLEDTLKILSHRLDGVEVHRDLKLAERVECAPALINQVLMNLLSNAIDAIGGKGEIWLGSERVGDRARLRIRDSGEGIRVEDRDRIFRPYFTTKRVGSGTGMGLAISKQIVEHHGGTLTVTSLPGQGAELTIELPLSSTLR
jgi:signal transduction histidine kinase